jgi:hypothetical protein
MSSYHPFLHKFACYMWNIYVYSKRTYSCIKRTRRQQVNSRERIPNANVCYPLDLLYVGARMLICSRKDVVYTNADEHRYFPVTELGATHRKRRKERKAQPPCRTRITRIQRIFTNPCQSAKSAFYRSCSYMKSTDRKVSRTIRVHLRFFNWGIFQTGLTGCVSKTNNNSFILSNLKSHLLHQKRMKPKNGM